MITLDDLRVISTALPEVREETHFKLPAFKVRDKVIVVLQAGDGHAIVHVDPETAASAAVEMLGACEQVWRGGGIFVGLQVDLAEIEQQRLASLIVRAWRHRAPKRLVAAHDAGT